MFQTIVSIILHILALPALLWIIIYVNTNLYMLYAGPVNMKKKSNAPWALVTGAGIGESIAETMALHVLGVWIHP